MNGRRHVAGEEGLVAKVIPAAIKGLAHGGWIDVGDFMDGPDGWERIFIAIDVHAVRGAEYFGLIVALRLLADPIIDSQQIARPIEAAHGIDIERERGQVAAEDVDAVPIAEVVLDLLVIELDADRWGRLPQPGGEFGIGGELREDLGSFSFGFCIGSHLGHYI